MVERPYSRQHISAQFSAEIDAVKSDLLEMGGKVENQIELAAEAITQRDSSIAERVLLIDREINRLEIAIDEQCIRILARRQPAASDLRLIIAITRLTRDLERIGDEASRVAKLAIQSAELDASSTAYTSVEVKLENIAHHVIDMLNRALDAFARLSAADAILVVLSDTDIDKTYRASMKELQAAMAEAPVTLPSMLQLMWALRSFERIGDHASNIAEQVIYLVTGEDVRHLSADTLRLMLD